MGSSVAAWTACSASASGASISNSRVWGGWAALGTPKAGIGASNRVIQQIAARDNALPLAASLAAGLGIVGMSDETAEVDVSRISNLRQPMEREKLPTGSATGFRVARRPEVWLHCLAVPGHICRDLYR